MTLSWNYLKVTLQEYGEGFKFVGWSTPKDCNREDYSKQSNLLIMDEATSALDFNTERQLCLNLQEWSAGKTVFLLLIGCLQLKTQI